MTHNIYLELEFLTLFFKILLIIFFFLFNFICFFNIWGCRRRLLTITCH